MDLNERQFAPTTGRSILRVRETMDPIESYEDRDGYDPGFLEGAFRVEMPGLGQWSRSGAVASRLDKEGEYIVPYRHFSVIVCAERRMPLVCLHRGVVIRGPKGPDQSDQSEQTRLPDMINLTDGDDQQFQLTSHL